MYSSEKSKPRITINLKTGDHKSTQSNDSLPKSSRAFDLLTPTERKDGAQEEVDKRLTRTNSAVSKSKLLKSRSTNLRTERKLIPPSEKRAIAEKSINPSNIEPSAKKKGVYEKFLKDINKLETMIDSSEKFGEASVGKKKKIEKEAMRIRDYYFGEKHRGDFYVNLDPAAKDPTELWTQLKAKLGAKNTESLPDYLVKTVSGMVVKLKVHSDSLTVSNEKVSRLGRAIDLKAMELTDMPPAELEVFELRNIRQTREKMREPNRDESAYGDYERLLLEDHQSQVMKIEKAARELGLSDKEVWGSDASDANDQLIAHHLAYKPRPNDDLHVDLPPSSDIVLPAQMPIRATQAWGALPKARENLELIKPVTLTSHRGQRHKEKGSDEEPNPNT